LRKARVGKMKRKHSKRGFAGKHGVRRIPKKESAEGAKWKVKNEKVALAKIFFADGRELSNARGYVLEYRCLLLKDRRSGGRGERRLPQAVRTLHSGASLRNLARRRREKMPILHCQGRPTQNLRRRATRSEKVREGEKRRQVFEGGLKGARVTITWKKRWRGVER